VGVDHLMFRLVGARLTQPKFLIGKPGFHDFETTVAAWIVDYAFGDDFDGWWIGTGFEVWLNSIAHDDATGPVRWTNVVYTLGGGYIWKFYGDFYLNPWVGMHVPLNNHPVHVGGHRFRPWPVSAEVSLKIGWNLEL